MSKPTDLKFEFDEILIPSIEQMLQKEEDHLEYLKQQIGKEPHPVIQRAIDLSRDSARLYRQRILEYKEYSSNL